MKLLQFLVNIKQTLYSCLKIILRTRFSGCFKYRISNPNDPIIILGNGPSLRQSLDKYSSIIQFNKTLCVNAFALSDDYEKVKPDFYVMADPGLWINQRLNVMKEYRKNIYNAIGNKTKWPMIFLIPISARKNIDFPAYFSENKNITVKYFNRTTVYGFPFFRNIIYKFQLGMPMPLNVLVPSLMLSINMGFRRIFIIGADHSWHESLFVDENNTLSLLHKHFTTFREGHNKAIPIRNPNNNRPMRLHEQFGVMMNMFKNYFIIEKYAHYRKASIHNASEKSYIDAFNRTSLEKLNK